MCTVDIENGECDGVWNERVWDEFEEGLQSAGDGGLTQFQRRHVHVDICVARERGRRRVITRAANLAQD